MLSSLKLWKEDLFDLGPIYRSSDRTMRDRFGKAHEEISQQCSWVRDHDYQSRYQRVLSITTTCRSPTRDPQFHCGAVRHTSNEKSHVAQIDRAWISITRRRDSKEVIQKQRHGMRATEISCHRLQEIKLLLKLHIPLASIDEIIWLTIHMPFGLVGYQHEGMDDKHS